MRLVTPAAGAARSVGVSLGAFTLGDLIAMDELREGDPAVVTGREYLGRVVGWLRATGDAATSGVVRAGEVALACGVDLQEFPGGPSGFIGTLADEEAVGLVVQLDEQLSSIPLDMVRACKAREVPLIVLRSPVRIAQVAEAANSLIVGRQQSLLRTTLIAHERFTELGAAAASPEEIVAAVGELTGGHVVFSNLMHQALAVYATNGAVAEAMHRWSHCAYALNRSAGPQEAESGEWMAVPVEAHGRERGWLVHFPLERPDPARPIVLERAAGALAMSLLLDDDESVVATAERAVLADLLVGRHGSTEAIHARTAALGHSTRDRYYLSVVVLADESHDVRSLLASAVKEAGVDALIGQLGPGRWGVLLLLDDGDDAPADVFARHLAREFSAAGGAMPTLGRGSVVSRLGSVGREFAEAGDVASAARAVGGSTGRHGLFSIEDVKLRGLLYTLRHEPRLQAFVERSLGPLQLRDALDGGQWVRTLSVYLRVNGNKSLAAQELGISRPTLYERLARIQRLLRVDLEDSETTTSLFAAIMVVEATPDVMTGASDTFAERRHHADRGVS